MTITTSCGATALELDGAASATYAQAGIRTHGLSLVFVDLCDGTVCDISWNALRQLGVTPAAVIGQPAAHTFGSGESTTRAIELMREGTVDVIRGTTAVCARAFTVGQRRIALVEVNLGGKQASSSLTPFLTGDRGTMVYATTNLDLVVRSVSDDVEELLGQCAAELVGRSLLRALDREGAQTVLQARNLVDRTNSVCFPLRLRGANGDTVRLRGMLTCLGTGGLSLLLARDTTPATESDLPRVARLERHLRIIADEVEASGVLVGGVTASAAPHFPGLTKRQSEILSRLIRGERVRTIAACLYISESTVRNHLAAIFERFGVHSQAELLDVVVTDLPRRQDT